MVYKVDVLTVLVHVLQNIGPYDLGKWGRELDNKFPRVAVAPLLRTYRLTSPTG